VQTAEAAPVHGYNYAGSAVLSLTFTPDSRAFTAVLLHWSNPSYVSSDTFDVEKRTLLRSVKTREIPPRFSDSYAGHVGFEWWWSDGRLFVIQDGIKLHIFDITVDHTLSK